MAITLGDLYRDINSFLSQQNINSERILHKDVVDSINDAIAVLRVEYVNRGKGQEFLQTEDLTSFSSDSSYPYLNQTTLTYSIERTLPIGKVVQSSVFHKTTNTIQDSSQTFNKGDVAIKGDSLYKCVESFTNVNSYDNIFDQGSVRNFYANNGFEYKAGDVVYNQSDGTYWKCDTDYTNDSDTSIDSTGNFSKLYWKKIGDAYYEARPVSFNNLHELKLKRSLNTTYPFSIEDNKVYVYGNLPLTISYVPEWQKVETLSSNLNIPGTMEDSIKRKSIDLLSKKIGVSVQLQTEKEDE